MSDTAVSALVMALLLILPISALIARRMPTGTVVRYGLAWLAVFAIGLLIVAQFT